MCGCNKRGKLIKAAAQAAKASKPVAPIVRGIGRSFASDAKAIRASLSKIISPRFR